MNAKKTDDAESLDPTMLDRDAPASPAEAKSGSFGQELQQVVQAKERRKLRSKREGRQSPWFGLGMFGIVGWSVALPTLMGIAIGTWIDRRWPSQISWTLTLLILGVAVGGMNAWYWIQKEAS